MSNLLTMIATLGVIVLLNFSGAFAQVDSFMINVQKHFEKADRERALRTDEENKLGGILYHLLQLSEAADTSQVKKAELAELVYFTKKDKFLDVDSNGRIRVVIDLPSLADTNNVKELIRLAGGEVKKVGLVPYISCVIHPKNLRKLISSPSVLLISVPVPGKTHDIVSAGDVQLKANLVRSQYGAYGDGIKIGVISDGVDHLGSIPRPNELPFNVTVIPGRAGSGNEGTAMLEIVHDLAPNAELFFCSGFGPDGYRDLADAITALRSQSCKIIVDDIWFSEEPFFTDEDGELGAAIRSFISGGGVYVSSAGNNNYDIVNPNGYKIYSGVTNFISDVNIFASNLTYLEVEVPEQEVGIAHFQWAEQWINPSHDYGIYVFDETGNNVGLGAEMNTPFHSHLDVLSSGLHWYRSLN